MDWREYQEAAAALFESAGGIGRVRRNVMVPDRVTGEPRQVDALLEIETKDLVIQVVIDAKFHSDRIDVTHVESVLALTRAVGASQAMIVAANGWTAPAERKAAYENVTLRLLTIDEALELMVPNKWSLCPGCERDCLVLEHENAMVINGLCCLPRWPLSGLPPGVFRVLGLWRKTRCRRRRDRAMHGRPSVAQRGTGPRHRAGNHGTKTFSQSVRFAAGGISRKMRPDSSASRTGDDLLRWELGG